MSNKILGLRTTIYHVSDMTKAKDWYAKAFMTTPYFDEPFYAGFNIGGFELGLQPEEHPMKEKPESVVSYWGVDDLEAEYKRLLGLGAAEHQPPQDVGEQIKVAVVKDPWGNCIGLIYNPHFRL